MTTTSLELPRCDTELSLGRAAPAPSQCRATDELKQRQKQAAATPCCGGDLTATELQAMAIQRMARRAAAAEDEGAAAGLSMRRSIEWFLQLRWEARHHHQHGVAAENATASPSSSSSSLSCLTDSSRI